MFALPVKLRFGTVPSSRNRLAASAVSSTAPMSWLGGYTFIVASTRSASRPNSAFTAFVTSSRKVFQRRSASSRGTSFVRRNRRSPSDPPVGSPRGSVYFPFWATQDPSTTASSPVFRTAAPTAFCILRLVAAGWAPSRRLAKSASNTVEQKVFFDIRFPYINLIRIFSGMDRV